MAFTDENMVMPVSPMGNGFGNSFGGDGWWMILLFLLLLGGGNGFGGYGNGAAPFIDSTVQRGFDQSAIINGLNGIQGSVTGGFANAEVANNSRQMADMQTMFGIQSALQNCCCENRSNIADLKYTVATENCADRAAVESGIRDVITNQTSNTQKILDALCANTIEEKNAQIQALERQLAMANLQASQVAQTAEILSKLPASTTAGA